MEKRTYLAITGIAFLIISLLHLIRTLLSWSVQIGSLNISVWLSWIAFVIAGYLSFEAFRLMKD